MGEEQRGFTDQELRILERVFDEFVPPSPDGLLPGASELGLGEHVDRALAPTPDLRAIVAESVSALAELANRRHDRRFVDLPADVQAALLRELETTPQAFTPILALHVYTGYYRHPRVLAALGLAARPPHPEGYEMEPNDLTLLDAVRRRAAMYRKP